MTHPAGPELFPLFLRLDGRRVLVVGGGVVAERKVRELMAASAEVVVVAPRVTRFVSTAARRAKLELHRRTFVPRDVRDVWLVIAATDDVELNARIARAAGRRRVFVNAVDDPDRCSALFASIVRRPPFTVAISSRGEAPALSRLLRELVEHVLPHEAWVERARILRARWKADGTPMTSRFGELVSAFAADAARSRTAASRKTKR